MLTFVTHCDRADYVGPLPSRKPSETKLRTPSPIDPEMLALRALAHVVGDERLGPRLLATTGLTVEMLRASAGSADTLAAVLDFLLAHEADLVTVAAALDVAPDSLALARRQLTT